jgi:hypothetical protein
LDQERIFILYEIILEITAIADAITCHTGLQAKGFGGGFSQK